MLLHVIRKLNSIAVLRPVSRLRVCVFDETPDLSPRGTWKDPNRDDQLATTDISAFGPASDVVATTGSSILSVVDNCKQGSLLRHVLSTTSTPVLGHFVDLPLFFPCSSFYSPAAFCSTAATDE